MIVAEMRPADMPVKILGLEIKRKGIGQQCVQRTGNILGGIGAEVDPARTAEADRVREPLFHGWRRRADQWHLRSCPALRRDDLLRRGACRRHVRPAGFIFTTALPPAICAATTAAIHHLKSSNWERAQHQHRAARTKAVLTAAGLPVMPSEMDELCPQFRRA
jgi:hypothetical protein